MMRLAHISWKRAEEYFKSNDTVLVGVGSIESHGTHTALGTDMLVPNRLIDMIEDNINVIIAPTIPYGACDHLLGFPGTVSLSEDVLYLVIKQVTESLKRHGAKKFVFLNGHGGNVSTIKKICLELSEDDCLGTIINWWLLAGELNRSWKGGHGGAQETSAVMAIDESFVDLDMIEETNLVEVDSRFKQKSFYDVEFKGIAMPIPRVVRRVTDNGWIGPDHPSNATVEWGKEMLDATAEFITEYINEFSSISIEPKED